MINIHRAPQEKHRLALAMSQHRPQESALPPDQSEAQDWNWVEGRGGALEIGVRLASWE